MGVLSKLTWLVGVSCFKLTRLVGIYVLVFLYLYISWSNTNIAYSSKKKKTRTAAHYKKDEVIIHKIGRKLSASNTAKSDVLLKS